MSTQHRVYVRRFAPLCHKFQQIVRRIRERLRIWRCKKVEVAVRPQKYILITPPCSAIRSNQCLVRGNWIYLIVDFPEKAVWGLFKQSALCFRFSTLPFHGYRRLVALGFNNALVRIVRWLDNAHAPLQNIYIIDSIGTAPTIY